MERNYYAVVRKESQDATHYKYIKKIGKGKDARYFYTMEALKAYYKAESKKHELANKVANTTSDVSAKALYAKSSITGDRDTAETERSITTIVNGYNRIRNTAVSKIAPIAKTATLAISSLFGSSKASTLLKRSAKSLAKKPSMRTVNWLKL